MAGRCAGSDSGSRYGHLRPPHLREVQRSRGGHLLFQGDVVSTITVTISFDKSMTIVISVTSSIIAAFLAHYLATNRMLKNHLTKVRFQAYSDFIGSSSKVAIFRRMGNTEDHLDDLAALNDAKNRILICGDRPAVEALIEFWQYGGTLEGESELLAFKHLCQKFRESLGHKKNDLLDLEVSNILFKLQPSSYSFKAQQVKRFCSEKRDQCSSTCGQNTFTPTG